MPDSKQNLTGALLSLIACSSIGFTLSLADDTRLRRIDPAAWGDDHVDKAPPPYVTGDECLFCHRKIGTAWSSNAHQLTIRPSDRCAN